MTESHTRGSLEEWADLVCPLDHASLTWQPTHATCTHCSREYPIRVGIPDLRLHPDPYLSGDEDLAAAERLAAREADLTYDALLQSYYATNTKVSAEMAARFAQGARSGEARAALSVAGWSSMGVRLDAEGRAIDVGCGTGALAVVLASRGMTVTALDVGLRWLVIARARARDADQRIRMICANADALPFASGSHQLVAGESIVENILKQPQLFSGISRVLAPSGHCALYVPNKYSPAPDPHLGIPGGGMLPTGWSASIARRRGDVPPVRAMLSRARLRRLLHGAALADVRFALPVIAPEQLAQSSSAVRAAAQLYALLGRTPLVKRGILAIAPSWLVVARATNDRSPTTPTAHTP